MTFACRQDFGFGNPNVAGAFFAVLVLAVFLIPARARWVEVLRFLSAGIFFGCVLLTASRGALVGLGLGSLAAWFMAGFPRPRTGWLIPIFVALIVILFGVRTVQRMSSLSVSEGSTASRIAIYRCVPSMIVAAPCGWGAGRSSDAYENWFQKPDDSTKFKNLLSTHATWIVERGIVFFALYLLAWGLALWGATPLTFGVLNTWGFCCAFSHVGAAWWMWVLPVAACAVSLFHRVRNQALPSFVSAIVIATSLIAIFLAALIAGMLAAPGLHFDGRVLRVGSQQPTVWFLAPDPSVMGKTCGKQLRSLGNLAIAQKWDDLESPSLLVLSGTAPVPSEPCAVDNLIWLNPPTKIDSRLMQVVGNARRKTVMWGGLRSDANPDQIRTWMESLPDSRWISVQGRGKYLGDALGCVTEL